MQGCVENADSLMNDIVKVKRTCTIISITASHV